MDELSVLECWDLVCEAVREAGRNVLSSILQDENQHLMSPGELICDIGEVVCKFEREEFPAVGVVLEFKEHMKKKYGVEIDTEHLKGIMQ